MLVAFKVFAFIMTLGSLINCYDREQSSTQQIKMGLSAIFWLLILLFA